MANVLVIGIGNEFRSDDGIGLKIARNLARLECVRFIEESGEGAALMAAWRGAESVILIDAVHSGGTPGTIYRFDAWAQRIPSSFYHYSSHAFSIAEAIELARILGELPRHLIVFGIEGKHFDAGTEISPEVAKAGSDASQQILNEIERLRKEAPCTNYH